jgi:hypothetical protein
MDHTPSMMSLEMFIFCLLTVCVLIGFLERYRSDPACWKRWRGFVPALLLLFLVVNMPPAFNPIPETTLQLPAEAKLEVDSMATIFATSLYDSEKVLLPVTEGARWSLEGQRVVVEQIRFDGSGITVNLQFLRRGVEDLHDTPISGGLFALHDPITGEVAFGRKGSGQWSGFHRLFSIGSYEITFQNSAISRDELSRFNLYHIRHALAGIDVRSVSYPVDSRE